MLARGDPGAIGPARAPAQVSVILPVHDAEPWLDECLGSVLQQDFEGSMELSIFNDASKDKSMTIIEKWKKKLEDSGILVVIGGHDSPSPRGVGYSKNQAVAQSSGSYLCFLDADDVMMPQRVRLQHEAALRHPESIIGCQVTREPPNSTERYMRWINQLAPDQLLTQVFTSNGPTVIMPTWFCSRAWFAHVGPFDEGGRGRTHAGLWLRNRDVDPDCSPSLLDSLRGNTPTEHPVRRVSLRTCCSSTSTSGRAVGSSAWTRASSSTATTPAQPHTPSSRPPSGPTVSASWKSRPCPTGQLSPSGTRAGRAAGSTAA